MLERLKIAPLALGAMFVLALGAAPSRADFDTSVSPSFTLEASGSTLYSYTVTNLGTSTSNIGEFDINVSTDAALTSIVNPTGFLALYTTGDSFISFLSTDASFDLKPLASVVFSFESVIGPGIQDDLVRSFDSPFAQNPGSTIAPRTVPEPASLALSGLGALVFAGLNLRNRRRGRSS